MVTLKAIFLLILHRKKSVGFGFLYIQCRPPSARVFAEFQVNPYTYIRQKAPKTLVIYGISDYSADP
jgi:hypothetical protein